MPFPNRYDGLCDGFGVRDLDAVAVRTVRLSDESMAMVEAWAQVQNVGRSEAIRRLVELGLKAKA